MRLIDIEPLQKEHWHLHRYVAGVYDARIEEMELEKVPTVDAAPVKHGRWMKMTGMMPPEYVGHYECSVCQWHGSHHNATEREYRFCPRCGAKMDAEAGD